MDITAELDEHEHPDDQEVHRAVIDAAGTRGTVIGWTHIDGRTYRFTVEQATRRVDRADPVRLRPKLSYRPSARLRQQLDAWCAAEGVTAQAAMDRAVELLVGGDR